MCAAIGNVRFTPNSDRKSRHAANVHVCFRKQTCAVQTVMSALGQKRTLHACFEMKEAANCGGLANKSVHYFDPLVRWAPIGQDADTARTIQISKTAPMNPATR
jgi:hypothetical protein